jgi:hypothetical protein
MERPFVQATKENIQHFKTRNFNFFLFLWVIFALMDQDPDPHSQCGSGFVLGMRKRIRIQPFNADTCGSGSEPRFNY